jgi:hypothetical protein
MNKKVIVLISLAFATAVLVAIVISSFGNAQYRCEVCITFRGRQSCRIARAITKEGALRTATDNACAQISSGVTDSQQCTRTPPDSVTWK